MKIMIKIFLISLLLMNTLHGAQKLSVIAFAQDDMANDFRKAQVYEVRDEAKKYKNVKFVYSDAKAKTSRLIYQIDNFIKDKVDVIIVGTNDADAVVPVITKAYKSGIHVIILDRGVNSSEYTTFINSDNIKIGSMGARFIAKELNYKGTVLLFEGLLKADVTKLRTQGFMDEMQKHKDIKVIKRTGNYLRRDAIKEMEKLIKDKVKIDAIFSESDSMLSGVRSAMQRFKQDPSSLITVGCDYTSEAQTEIRKGNQTASIKFPLGGKQALIYAVDLLQGKTLAKHIFIPVELVTKKNVENVAPIF